MRFLEKFWLAALVALSSFFMAGIQSATANSTALCTSNEEGELYCSSPYTGHVETAAIASSELITSVGTVTCFFSTILGNALGLNSPLVGHIELMDFFGNCRLGIVGCTVTTTETGSITLLKFAANRGSLSSQGNWVLVKCGGLIHCEYGGTFFAGTIDGSSGSGLATVWINAFVERREVLFLEGCPTGARWSAAYEVELPHDLFIKS